ncbi:MAG: PH domain-containing protein [Gammaproteobacteria bacterium]|nr:PH domain-containing protein [Gammaproteobacteria bacterium]
MTGGKESSITEAETVDNSAESSNVVDNEFVAASWSGSDTVGAQHHTIVDEKHTVFEAGQKPTLPLAPGALPYFKISEAIVFAVIFVALMIGQIIFLISKAIWPEWWWIALEIIGLIGFFYWLVFAYPKLKFLRTRWRFDDQGLFIYQGIIFRKQYAVPRSRVQHIDVTQGPIQRNYSIAELVIHTAGTMNASVNLTGIAFGTAVDVRDKLLNQEQHDAV